jgi:hypothetical protein
VFAETGKLTTSCAALTKGVKVVVANETATAQPINLVPLEFKNKAGGTVVPKEVCGGLEVSVPKTVAGGRSATATLSAEEGKSELSGSLVLFAAAGAVSRREVSISPKVAAETIEETPLVESQAVRLEGSNTGPIWIPVEASSEATAPAVATGGKPAEEPAKERVGVVSGKNGSAPVVFEGAKKSLGAATEQVKLELDTDGLDPGAYSGSVDLNPGDEEAGKVMLEVKVAAYWWLAALLLIAGIVVSLGLQRLAGRLSPRKRLRSRMGGLSKRSERLETALQTGPGKDKPWAGFTVDRDNLSAVKADLESQLTDASECVVIQIDKKVLESLEAAIVVVEAQVDLLKQIPEHAGDLERELDKLPSREGKPPALDAEARRLLHGGILRADELKARVEEIDTKAKQVRTLLVLLDRLEDLRQARHELNPLGGDKLKALDKAIGTIDRLLWTAETAEDLETAAEEIQDAAKEAAELWQELPEPPAFSIYLLQTAHSRRPMLAQFAFADDTIELLSEEAAAIEALEGTGGPSTPPQLPAEPPAPALNAESIKQETARAIVAQSIAVVIAAFVAVATGLVALYATNETWGSCWDLIAAAIWGLGAQAAVSTLATSLDGLGTLGRGS